MIQSRAIDIFRKLNRNEFLQLGKYLKSSLFTSNKKLPLLFSFLKKYYPDFTSDKITKENIFNAVFCNAAYNDGKTRRLLSDLYRETERFLVIISSVSDKNIFEKILLKQFDRRKLDNLFISRYEEYTKYLEDGKKNSDYFLEKFLTEWRNILFYMERGLQHKISENIFRRTEYLIFFFLCDLSLSLNDIHAHKESFNMQSRINLPEKFISLLDHKTLFEFINTDKFRNSEIVYVYYMGYLVSNNPGDESYYYKLKEFTLNNAGKFNEYLMRASIIPLMNYCIKKVSSSYDTKFDLELYSNYSLYIKYRLYNITGSNYIRNDMLLNIFSNYFKVGKTREVKKFLEDNIQSIQPAHRKNMLALSGALINFENRNFGESLKNVSLIKSDTFLYKDMMKILALKNNYELKNYDIAKELANSYTAYLTAKKDITEFRRSKRFEFLYYYQILWKFSEGKKAKQSIKDVKNEILKKPVFTESQWILKKLDELLK